MSTTKKLGGDILRCGRWVLRQTKIRQSRVSGQIASPKMPPTQDLSKKRKRQPSSVPSEESCVGKSSIPVDLSKKRKNQSSFVPSEESCIGENTIPVPAILHRNRICTLLDLRSVMSSSQNRPWQYDQEKMTNWRFPLNPMTMRVCFLLGNSDGFSGSHKPSTLIDLSLMIILQIIFELDTISDMLSEK